MACVPALIIFGLSLVTSLQNCCVAGVRRVLNRGSSDGQPGCFSGLYNGLVLTLWLAFWFMSTAGLCIYAYRVPASLGMGNTSVSKSYQMVRACVLYASLGGVALLSRSFSLWDTNTAQMLLRDLSEARFLKRAMYWMLFAQMVLYLAVCLTQMDYAFITCILGLNYLSSKSPQMLWAYALLSLATLPQDAEQLSSLVHWQQMDVVERTSRAAFTIILALKVLVLFGMLVLHTKVRFRLRFFELTDEDADEPQSSTSTPYSTPSKQHAPRSAYLDP
jgi:hypothetical protein